MLRTLLVIVVSIVAISLASPVAQAQNQTAPPVDIARASLDALPGRYTDVQLLRIILQPAGTLSMASPEGWRLAAVECGALTIVADRPLPVLGEEDSATPPPESTITIDTHSWTLIPPGADAVARNDGLEPVSILMLVLSWANAATPAGPLPGVDDPTLLDSQLISAVSLDMGAGVGELSISRATIAPGANLEELTIAGFELGGIEQGQGTISVGSGRVLLLRRATLDSSGAPEELLSGTSSTLNAGDGYVVVSSSHVTWTAVGNEPLVAVRARVATRPR